MSEDRGLPEYFLEIHNKKKLKKLRILTLISISPTLVLDRKIGLPTSDGKMCAGKFDPAYPHFTN